MAPRKDSWRHNEEVILCQAWITVGGDGAVGTDQTLDLLWNRIAEEYNAHKPTDCVTRTPSSCMARWKKINPACMKWRQALNKVETFQRRSGENMEDELMNVKSTYYDMEGKDFLFEHCWVYLKNTEKFGHMPTMENTNHSVRTPIGLDDSGTPTNEEGATSSRKARPKGQKAQKLAKKKDSQQDAGDLRKQMQQFQEQCEREYQQRQQQFEEGQLIEQRAEDARTMMVDPSIFTPRKRSYWERKQQQIIDKEAGNSSIPEQSQDPTPPEGDDTSLATYDPVHETSWM